MSGPSDRPHGRGRRGGAAAPDIHDEVEHDAEAEGLSESEEEDAVERAGPRAPVVYASISARGRDELVRPALSLFGSGVSAGLVIMVSLLAQGLLQAELPEFAGKGVVTDLGYTVGFVLVILGRMQLFTEATITPVLPLLAQPTRTTFGRTARLWAIVLAGNLTGTFVAALMMLQAGIVTPEHLAGIAAVARAAVEHTPLEMLQYGVVAGFLIAALVWCTSAVEGNELLLVLLVTYVIALGDFAHVVVGSGEVFFVLLEGGIALDRALALIAMAFVGNVLGGTVLFAALAYVQVMEELSAGQREAELRKRRPERAGAP